MHSFTLSLLLLPALASLASSADKLPPLNAFQNRKTSEFLFFFFHTGTKAVEQWSEITADVQAVFFLTPLSCMHKETRAALKIKYISKHTVCKNDKDKRSSFMTHL